MIKKPFISVFENPKQIVPVFFAVDDNYAPTLHVTVESIISQASPKNEYHLHIMVENLSEANKKSFLDRSKNNIKVFVRDMTDLSTKYAKEFYNRDYYTNTAWFRLFIPNMYPQYNKAVYLDADTVCNCDIAELYDHDIGDNYAAVSTCETCASFEPFTKYIETYMGFKLPWYFNSGVLLLNLDALRKENFENRFFDLLNKHQFELIQDQDSLNVLFKGKCVFLPQVWNKIPLPVDGIDDNNVKIVHFNLVFRPWRYDGIDFVGLKYDKIPFEDIFWKHAKNCPAYKQLLEIKKNYSKEEKEKDLKMAQGLVVIAEKHYNLPTEKTWAGLSHLGIIRIIK